MVASSFTTGQNVVVGPGEAWTVGTAASTARPAVLVTPDQFTTRVPSIPASK